MLNVGTPPPKSEQKQINILVVDGGGLRGYLSLQILKKLEQQIDALKKPIGDKKKDSDDKKKDTLDKYFDMIVGTSTGGLIALGLGKLHMSCDDMQKLYDTVGEEVFKKNALQQYTTQKLCSVGSYFGLCTKYDSDKLAEIYKDKFAIIEGQPKNQRSMLWDSKTEQDEPLTAVIAQLVNNPQLSCPFMLKNYDLSVGEKGFVECNEEDQRAMPSLSQCEIWEAARATSAAPTYFAPIMIKMPDKLSLKVKQAAKDKCEKLEGDIIKLEGSDKKREAKVKVKALNTQLADAKKRKEEVDKHKLKMKFVDGGMVSNAPNLFAFAEARRVWPQKDYNINILSIGTGQLEMEDSSKSNYKRYVSPSKRAYKNLNVATITESMFSGKEGATTMPLYGFAEEDKSFTITRMNPLIDSDRMEMDDFGNKDYWIARGEDYAETVEMQLKQWAERMLRQNAADPAHKVSELPFKVNAAQRT